MKKITAIILALVLLLAFAGCNGGFGHSDTEGTMGQTTLEASHESTFTDIPEKAEEPLFDMTRYTWHGYLDKKTVNTVELGSKIADRLSKLKKTGQILPQLSSEELDEYSYDLPVERGTLWLEFKSGEIFRLNSDMTEIYKVESHFGEAVQLEMTDELRELISQAWYYYPNDVWSGTYDDGEVSMKHVFEADSIIDEVFIDSVYVDDRYESSDNKIKLRLRANKSANVILTLESYQSEDNLGDMISQNIDLVEGGETTVELTFYGFPYPYSVSVTVDNARIDLYMHVHYED